MQQAPIIISTGEKRGSPWAKLAAALIIITVVGVAVYFLFFRKKATNEDSDFDKALDTSLDIQETGTTQAVDVTTTTDDAIITLSTSSEQITYQEKVYIPLDLAIDEFKKIFDKIYALVGTTYDGRIATVVVGIAGKQELIKKNDEALKATVKGVVAMVLTGGITRIIDIKRRQDIKKDTENLQKDIEDLETEKTRLQAEKVSKLQELQDYHDKALEAYKNVRLGMEVGTPWQQVGSDIADQILNHIDVPNLNAEGIV
jgi:sugar-specific transcriptional regulator TrmB